MNRFKPGNKLTLLRNGTEYFPALERAIDVARREIWFETYIFADDASGRQVAAALERAANRGVKVRVMVEGPDEAVIRDVVSGHICRCTGYQAMIDAARAVAGRGVPGRS